MSAPLRGTAYLRYTEDSQQNVHYLGHPLHRPVANPAQEVYTFRPLDKTGTSRYVAIGGVAHDLSALVRFDGSPTSLLQFVAAARRGASIEYFPDADKPWLSFPCELVNGSDIRPDAAFWWNRRNEVELVLRRTDGGSWQALLEEPFFYWRAGVSLPGETFNRDDLVATYIDEDGVLQTIAAVDLYRLEYLDLDDDGVRGDVSVLLEAGATNDLTDPFDIDPDGAAWNENAAWTQVAATSFADGEAAIKFTNDGATSSHLVSQTLPNVLPATPVVGVLIVENVDALTTTFGVRDDGATDWVVRGTYTWATDSIVVADEGAGSSVGVRSRVLAEAGPNGGTLVRLEVFGTPDNAGNAATLFVYPTGLGTNSLAAILHYAAFEDDSRIVGSSPVEGTRDDELFQVPIGFAPKDIEAAGGATFYSKWVERGTSALAGSNRYWHIGGPTAAADPKLLLSGQDAAGEIQFFYDDGTSTFASQFAPGTIDVGDTVEARAVVFLDGSDWKIQLHLSIDGAAETSATAATIGSSLPAAWSANTLTIGANPEGAQVGLANHIEHKFQPGVLTLAEMRAL